ncbi:MAG: methyltransferase domain-containing protein [Gammaproteobacteria bacterium]
MHFEDHPISLDQRGRAGLQFLGSLQVYASGELLDEVRQQFAAEPEAQDLATDFKLPADDSVWRQRVKKAREVAERSVPYRFNRLYERYIAEENWVRGLTAVERKRQNFEPAEASTPVNERLILDPMLPVPEYHAGVEWHLQPGGWEGYDLAGPMWSAAIMPYVYSRGGNAAVEVNDDVREHRREVLSQFRHTPRRAYDVGCGGAGTLGIMRSLYPDTELVGGDFSARRLIDGHGLSERLGWNITFRQEDGRHVAAADNSFDAVISFALHHEMPREVTRDILKEMYRILEPGGEIVVSDIPPFRAVTPLQAALLDWETDYRAEPFFSESRLSNLGEILADIGFRDVDEYSLREMGYPWVTRAYR